MCKRVRVSMHHGKGTTKRLAHTNTNTCKNHCKYDHTQCGEKERSEIKTDRTKERKCKHVYWCTVEREGTRERESESAREGVQTYICVHILYTNYTRIMCELSVCAIAVSTLLLLRTNKNKRCVKLCAHVF